MFTSMKQRKIIHVDMDAFFTSVEQMDRAELRGKPIAVGGSRERGVVAAASYEARKFGVHSAQPSSIAARKCPDLIFVKPRFDRYKEVSSQIMDIFKSFTDLVEPLSLDEAYLDVTYNKRELKSAIKIAMLLRKEIKEKVGLTASAGVSFNKFLAKTASDLHKPDGLSVILPDQAIDFMRKMEVKDFHGIGKRTAEKMNAEGIYTGEDLMGFSKLELMKKYGKAGKHFYHIVQADDQREVKANRIRKSIGAEQTFSKDLESKEEYVEELRDIFKVLMERLKKSGRKAKTLTLKIKYHNFIQRTRSQTLTNYTNDAAVLWEEVIHLLHTPNDPEKAVRLFGISLSNLDLVESDERGQLTIDF